MNVYRSIPYDAGPAGFEGIAVNGEPLEPDPDDDFAWRDHERTIIAIMCHEFGKDVSRHPVHYTLLFDRFYDITRKGDDVQYYWEITSNDLAAAVSRAQKRLAGANEEDLFSAINSLRPTLSRELIKAGIAPGDLAHYRLIMWYKYDQIDHYRRRQRREILELLLAHDMDPCIRSDNFCTWGTVTETLLHLMCGSCTPVEDIGLLLAAGAATVLNCRDNAGNTPLLRYAAKDFDQRHCPPKQAGFDLLLEYGTEITARNGQGKTAVQLLLGESGKPQKYRARRRALAEYLVDRGA